LLTILPKTAIFLFVKTKEPWRRRIWQETVNIFRWMIPGIGVKRWLIMILMGITLLGVGLAFMLLDIYRTAPETWWLPLLSYASLRFLDRTVRVMIFGSLGIGLIAYGIWGLNHNLLIPFRTPGTRLVDQISDYRRRKRGRRIVVIGGGHGLATLLRGLKEHTHNLTAIVTVADDGGSSGELRRSLGVLPPGDIRDCLAALSNDEALLTQLFQYRFSSESGLSGHSFGNLFITALSEVTGSFEEAVAESARVLGVNGEVLPATLHDVRLLADVQIPYQGGEVRVEGESTIPTMPGRVRRVWLEPNNPPAFPPVIQSILQADMIIIGPGSLYTSILPNLLVPDLIAAVRSSKGLKIFVCNIATQRGETMTYTCSDHIRAVEDHVGEGLVDIVVCNRNYSLTLPEGVDWVRLDESLDNIPVYAADLVDTLYPWRHDSIKLAQALIDLLNERTGPLSERDDSQPIKSS
jgi:uncharacterized cofD-like protein